MNILLNFSQMRPHGCVGLIDVAIGDRIDHRFMLFDQLGNREMDGAQIAFSPVADVCAMPWATPC